MNCNMTRGIYLRANGELNCYCSTGEQVTLGKLPPKDGDWNFVRDVYRGKRFSRVREAMARDILPFPRFCTKCNYLSPEVPAGPEGSETIEWVHLEASALCNLRCPFCVHGASPDKGSRLRPKPHFLDPDLYRKMLDDIRDAGMGIRWIYFSGRGEPTLHPQVWNMVAETKERFDTNFLVNTNGNARFDPMIVDSGLDKIKIALDSLEQDVYARYRIGGSVETLLRLTDQIAEYKARTGRNNPTIVWQKVLFSFNSTPEQVAEYQRAAQRHGVDRIRLFFTWTKDFAERSLDEYDLFFPDIEIHNPYQRGLATPEELDAARLRAREEGSPGGMIKVLSNYMHWAEHGTDDRFEYDAYARMGLCRPELYALRGEDEHSRAHFRIFNEALHDLAELYAGRGETIQANLYRGLFARLGA